MIAKENIRKLAQERIDELNNGLFIVDINISSKPAIYVELDKADGNVAIEDCVSVSRNIEHNLDREQQDFELHVSSAGIDKPLRVVPQFVKNVGREVEVVLLDGAKLKGELAAADAAGIIVKIEEKVKIEGKKKKELRIEERRLAYSETKETKIVISFK